jgi:hypothetical protein
MNLKQCVGHLITKTFIEMAQGHISLSPRHVRLWAPDRWLRRLPDSDALWRMFPDPNRRWRRFPDRWRGDGGSPIQRASTGGRVRDDDTPKVGGQAATHPRPERRRHTLTYERRWCPRCASSGGATRGVRCVQRRSRVTSSNLVEFGRPE